jgi:undecaprenyl diphosphate synthase
MAETIDEGAKAPYHLGIIPDGNRRWTRRSRINLREGYYTGIMKLVDSAIWAKELGIKVITSWALSKENLQNRSSLELNTLYKLYIKVALDKKIRRTIDDNGIRIKIVGELNLLPKNVREALKDLESHTSKNSDIIANILFCYSGNDDILYALRKSSRMKNFKDDESSFRNNLISKDIPDLDLIIRTSGEMRLSGFLPLQSTYAELYFTDKYWPEVQKKDLEDAVKEFARRKRRFGK